MDIRAHVDPPDAILLVMAAGIGMFLAYEIHQLAVVVGGIVAYAALIIALVVLPRRWFTNGD